jgi:hypothetical protein
MTKLFSLVTCCAAVFITCSGWAGTEVNGTATTTSTTTKDLGPVPLDLFDIHSGYVFESDLNHGGSFGKQDEIENEFDYTHRIQLSGNYYWHLGLSYDRYDFGSTSAAPIPNHLQTFAGVFGVDYMHGSDVGAFFQIRPGFYTQDHIGISSFDVPITFGRIFVLQEDKLYVFAGAYVSFLGNFPFLPLPGIIWIPSDKWRLMGVLPSPKLIYSATDKIELWVGGDLVGGSFRTDNSEVRPAKLRNAQVDFSDYRVAIGLKYQVNKSFSVNASGGCSVQRRFDFGRAGETYRTDPSPYLSLQMSAAF